MAIQNALLVGDDHATLLPLALQDFTAALEAPEGIRFTSHTVWTATDQNQVELFVETDEPTPEAFQALEEIILDSVDGVFHVVV